jgi:hypothetical protein
VVQLRDLCFIVLLYQAQGVVAYIGASIPAGSDQAIVLNSHKIRSNNKCFHRSDHFRSTISKEGDSLV